MPTGRFNRRFGPAAGANTVTVGSGGQYTSIAAAAAAAVSGQAIYVAPGTYTETSVISLANGVSLYGDGRDFTHIVIADSLTTDHCFILGGNNCLSGLDIYRNVGQDVLTEQICIYCNGPTITIEDCTVRGGSDHIFFESTCSSSTLIVQRCKFPDPRWYQLTFGQPLTGVTAYVVDNIFSGDYPATTGTEANVENPNIYATAENSTFYVRNNECNMTTSRNHKFLTFLYTASTSTTATTTYYSTGNRISLNVNSSTTPAYAFHGIRAVASGYGSDVYSSNDEIKLAGSGTLLDAHLATSLTGTPTYNGAWTLRNTLGTRFSTQFDTAKYPTMTLAGSSLDNASYANADAATISVNPNRGTTQTIGALANNRTLAVLSGTYFTGQEFQLLFLETGTHTLTPDGTSVIGSVLTGVANKTVASRYRYNGTAWIESAAPQTTGY